MIEINLLPEEIKKKKRPSAMIDISAIDVSNVPVISIVMRTVAVVLIIQLILFVIGVVSGATFKSLKREYEGILPEKKATEKLKKRVDTTNRKVASIDELMVKRFSWEKNLNSLSDSMTPGIWLTELEYDEKLTAAPKSDLPRKKSEQAAENVLSRYLILSGAAFSIGEEGTALIGRFIKNLKNNPAFYSDFSDIELGTIKREKMKDQEIMTFKITCFFKPKR